MNKTLTVFLALVAGLAGGLLSRYSAPPSAFAQNQAPVAKEIRAQSFTLIDSSNRAIGTFTSDADGPPAPPPPPGGGPAPLLQRRDRPARPSRIVLRDSDGREIWSAGEAQIRPLSQR
jgi:hypothetical protein